MENTISARFKHAWNAFFARSPTNVYREAGGSYYYRPDRVRFSRGNERSIVTSAYNRIAMDVSAIDIKHCYVDENGQYIKDADSGLNDCLTLEANIDQTSRAFIQDVVMTMFNEGVVAMVPVDTTADPTISASFDIKTMRSGKVVEWFPRSVKLNVYNDRTGQREDIVLPKQSVAIIENPFFAVMNEPNSTLQRLIRKLNILDAIDEQSGSGKLDLIIQLPYVIKGEARQQQAERRRRDIEEQLKGPYGIAYTDGTEKITQLNRPIENNLMKQIEYLTDMLYSQIGLTPSVLDGTADEKTMLNYNNRTIEPIVAAITGAMKRNFLTKTARTQGQTIMSFRDPFKLVPINNIAEIADKFTRNEILTSNEIRQIIGFKPSKDPKADKLVNSNISQPAEEGPSDQTPTEVTVEDQGSGEVSPSGSGLSLMDTPISELMNE